MVRKVKSSKIMKYIPNVMILGDGTNREVNEIMIEGHF